MANGRWKNAQVRAEIFLKTKVSVVGWKNSADIGFRKKLLKLNFWRNFRRKFVRIFKNSIFDEISAKFDQNFETKFKKTVKICFWLSKNSLKFLTFNSFKVLLLLSNFIIKISPKITEFKKKIKKTEIQNCQKSFKIDLK